MSEIGLYKIGNSIFHNADPRIKLSWMLVASIIPYTFFNPTIPAILFAINLLMLLLAVKGFAINNPLSKIFLIAALSSLLGHSFANPLGVTPIILWGSEIRVPFFGSMKWEGLYIGLVWAFRTLTMGYSSLLLITTTRPRDFVEALIKLKVPFTFAFLILLTLQLIHVFERDARIIVESQRSRGLRDVSIKDRLKALLPLFAPLVVMSIERVQIMSMSLEARAFGASTKRTELKEMKLSLGGYAVLSLLIGSTAALLVARLFWNLDWTMYAHSFRELFIPPKLT